MIFQSFVKHQVCYVNLCLLITIFNILTQDGLSQKFGIR